MCGLLISLGGPANPLFVRNKNVTPTWKRQYAICTERGSAYKKYNLTPQLAVNNTCVWFNGELVHTQDNYFDTTVFTQQ